MTMATWHREPKRLPSLAAHKALSAQALGLNADRLDALGGWERHFNPMLAKAECRADEGEWHPVKTINAEPDPQGGIRTTIEIPMAIGVQFPRGRFALELRAVHPHPECPDLFDTVPVTCDRRLRPGTRIDADSPDFPMAVLTLHTPVQWKRAEGESS